MQHRDARCYSTASDVTFTLLRPNITVFYSRYSEVLGVHCITAQHVSDVSCFNVSDKV
jgi:hypothetical protein